MTHPIPPTPECFASHLGLWAIEPLFMQQALAMIRNGVWQPRAQQPEQQQPVLAAPALDLSERAAPPPPAATSYQVFDGGVAVLPLHGPMMKARSKYGGTSTVEARRTLRAMLEDSRVGSILVHVDSPGGQVNGTKELADEIAAADERKPVHAYIEDVGASAAFWAVCGARSITCNAMAQVGSLGTIVMLHDTSGALDAAGVKVHVVTTAPLKALGAPGVPVTEAMLDEAHRLVRSLNEHFMQAVRAGREMTPTALASVADGRVLIGVEAVKAGLVDAVRPLDAVLGSLIDSKGRTTRSRTGAAAASLARLRLAEAQGWRPT